MAELNVFKTINDPRRNSCVDVFRGLAVVSVVVFHFNKALPLGYLGVDLFFVVSGLLIGGILIKEFKKGHKINFPKFFLQRGLKIWPSYYALLLLGELLVYWFYRSSHPDEVIPLWDVKRYLFFYLNYTGTPFRLSFVQLWSLCVEEHFYILLPMLFLAIQYFIPQKNQLKSLFVCIILAIVMCLGWKHFSYFFRGHERDLAVGTHNRIDALAWGVLLSLIIAYHGEKLKAYKNTIYIFIAGLLLFVAAIYLEVRYDYLIFDRLYLHAIMPVSFFLMIMGLYYVDLGKLKPIRFVAYYSYNWYLWHPVFYFLINDYFGNTVAGLLIYLFVTFLVAMATTIFIEEKILAKRKHIIDKLFKAKRPLDLSIS